MPVDFLTAEQTQQYGRFAGDPSPAQLGKYFFLDNKDRNEVCIRRGAHNRLGYALQLCTVRFLGTFLADPLAVPRLVVHHLARQLEIDDASCLSQYVERRHTPLEHAQEIRQRHGYGDFGEQPEHWRLVRWLYRRAWLTAERPVVLFDLATARLVEREEFCCRARPPWHAWLRRCGTGRPAVSGELSPRSPVRSSVSSWGLC